MFQQILQTISSHLDGVIACMILDPDAIMVAELYQGGDKEAVNSLAIELTSTLSSLHKRRVLEEVGAVDELVVSTSTMTAVFRTLKDGYTLLLVLEMEADVARGQTMLRLMAPWVARAL